MKLFFRDNHSNDFLRLKSVSPDFKAWILPILEKYYTGISVEKLLEIDGNFVNSQNLKSDGFFIKLIKHNGDKKHILNFPEISKHLQDFGIPTSRFINSITDEKIVDFYCEKTKQKYYLYVQEFTKGNFFSGKIEEIENLIPLINKMQNLKIPSDKESVSPYLNWNPKPIFKKVNNTLGSKNSLDDFDKIIVKHIDNIINSYDEVIKHIDLQEEYTKYLYHYDLHPHNMLFEKNTLSSITDLESFVMVNPMICTAFSIFKIFRKSVSKKLVKPEESLEIISRFYHDLDELYHYALLELLRRVTLILNLHYVTKNFIWDHDIKKQIIGLLELDVLFGRN